MCSVNFAEIVMGNDSNSLMTRFFVSEKICKHLVWWVRLGLGCKSLVWAGCYFH